MSALASIFTVEVRPDRERALVVPAGELDLATRPMVEQEVRNLLERGFGHLVIDLRELTFIDSAGIHLLLDARQWAHTAGSRLSVMVAPGAISRALELCHVVDLLELER